jgi:exodeoxyribonuclease V alpha subunit
MTTHLTVRMAWHDNNWNGKVCLRPEENVYCVGSHSLLSERLARNRNLDFEEPSAPIGRIAGYLPPCYWTTNAFSSTDYDIEYNHPFQGIRTKPMQNTLFASSVYTWPFRLSFNHSKKRKLEGEYPPDLSGRISRFIDKFTPTESFVFFYLNYDNPVSSEENKYVLVGCSLISDIVAPKEYQIDHDTLMKTRSPAREDYPKYKNFPVLDWTLPVIYDFQENGILLPYKHYLDNSREHESETEKLERMRVLIDEEELIPSFKYVANDIDDDKCIFLLYKLKKALAIINEDHTVDVTKEMNKIEEFLTKAWANRGLYPSIGKVLDVVAEFDGQSLGKGDQIVQLIKQSLKGDEDLLERTFDIMTATKTLPDFLKSQFRWVAIIRNRLNDDYADELELLKKLSLFSLTNWQITRIVRKRKDAFKKQLSSKSIAENPYLLAEEYVSEETQEDLNEEEIRDSPIGLFSIDIGMHPDPNYIGGNPSVQTLSPASKERIRAIAIEYLYQRGQEGDCFVRLGDLYEYIRDYPLFYRSDVNISEEKLGEMQGKFKDHFEERVTCEKNETGTYFYLNEAKKAEHIIEKTIDDLLHRTDYSITISNIPEKIKDQADGVVKVCPELDVELFVKERNNLFSKILQKHFFVISGRPGSGKTKVVGLVVKELVDQGEDVILLAPTGKASLRLKQEVKDFKLADPPQTIDRFVYSTEFRKCLESFENLVLLKGDEQRLNIQNLIIDESSMVDLQRMATLFEMLWNVDRKGEEKLLVDRIILVGDENQLPPIGFGRPFYDIIDYVKRSGKHIKENYVQLRSNCRQGYDSKILKIAELYETKNRYFEQALLQLEKGGQISKGFRVDLWSNFDELKVLITQRLDALCCTASTKGEGTLNEADRNEGLNSLFGLYENGHVKNFDPQTMKLESFQVLSPYRGEMYGTLGLNEYLKATYRSSPDWKRNYMRQFDHSDKIIRINNWYAYDEEVHARTLKLSNGSIGLVCHGKRGRQYFFHDREKPLWRIDDEDNFELAYAITVHKAQGSEFDDEFFVLPRKRGLLTKELLYTGLTRSKKTLDLFLQKSQGKGPLRIARENSSILSRNTSIFTDPEDIKSRLWPDKNVPVKSKIEYILYKYLHEAQKKKRLRFEYEKELLFKNKELTVHPDFTIKVGNRKYFWEHLGELDVERYSKDWAARRKDYEVNGLLDSLITTDDLEGVKEELILEVISALVKGKMKDTPDSKFSKHHYQLY